ncbi:hypothetical protein ACHAXA_005057 [Cyclostephanos tholiformis]|uniref:ABC transporter domain-containing protein n=1 Tax=Cyclostephanos tholiformis TaxID=382380 RepID=A0ABD3SSD4_9STRA
MTMEEEMMQEGRGTGGWVASSTSALARPAGGGLGGGVDGDALGRWTVTSTAATKSASGRTRTTGGMHLRWIRITKTVERKEGGAGLLRGSIADGSSTAPTREKGGAGGGGRAITGLVGRRKRGGGDYIASGAPGVVAGWGEDGGTVAKNDDDGNNNGKTKVILDGVSGSANPGEVLALMGPSGSGKTSVLDVLSGRSTHDGSGVITLDTVIVNDKLMKKMKKRVAYVKQADIFFGHLTVRDQLTYTALLRLPSEWPKCKKVEEVNRTIRRLRLNKCADTPINMISGGEKKRVNIGSELLTDPSIILLDEPTSGLDSTSAVGLMNILHELARIEGKTIITSIHQPSSAVFFAFDKLMLLSDGHVVYFGTPRGSLEHSTGGGGTTSTKRTLLDSWDAEAFARLIEDEDAAERNAFDIVGVEDGCGGKGRGMPRRALSRRESAVLTEKSFNATWWMQYKVLVHRSMKNSRSAIFTTLNFVKAGAIGFMCGLLWFQMPYTESTVFDRSSYYFFTMTFWVFDAMFTAYMTFPLERAIIFKERSSGAYRLSAYFIAKTTSEAPARLTLPSIYMLISYWMSGVNNDFRIFLASTLCSLLSVLAGESIGLFLGAAVLDMEKGMVVMTVVSLGLMVVGGFFVRTLPVWMVWFGYLSPFKYSYNSSVQLVFDKPVPCDGSKVLSSCQGGAVGSASVEEVLEFLGVEYSTGLNVALLFVMFVVIRIMAFFALKSKKADERT